MRVQVPPSAPKNPTDCIRFLASEALLIFIRLKAGLELRVLNGLFPLHGVTEAEVRGGVALLVVAWPRLQLR